MSEGVGIIPQHLLNTENARVLEFLQGRSCHPDITIPFAKFLENHKEFKSWCPDPENFSYCFWYVEDEIVAFAQGMQKISIKLSYGVPAGAGLVLQVSELGLPWHDAPYDFPYWSEIFLE